MKVKSFVILILVSALLMIGCFTGVQYTLAKESSIKVKAKEVKDSDQNDRSNLRSFYTAPPVIPHAVDSRNPKDCLSCHSEVTKLADGRVAMATPHPGFSNCQQCHVAKDLTGLNQVDNSWIGLEEPRYGDRWSGVSPPTIPHRTFLRENCLSCHNPKHPNMRMRTPHPNRTSCTQCHVPNAGIEF